MKKIALSALLSLSLFAGADVLQSSMTNMQNGLSNIQNGFLYNSIDLIKMGIKDIRKGNELFHNMENVKQHLPKEKAHMTNVAYNSSKRIDLSLDDLEAYLDKKEFVNASNAYSSLINSCTVCHSIVRGW